MCACALRVEMKNNNNDDNNNSDTSARKGYRGRANRHHHLFYGRHVIVGHTIAGWEVTERNISDWSSDSRGRLRVDQMRFDTRNYCYRRKVYICIYKK